MPKATPRLDPMALFRGAGDPDGVRLDRVAPVAGARDQELRPARNGLLGVGTLACNRCDAPVALGAGPMSVSDTLSCPFCSNHATVRDFLSLDPPTRPARVEVRVRIPGRLS
jgi:hypothetical protein